MERNDVFIGIFKTIKDSLERAYDVKNSDYASYICGVIALGNNLLDQLNKEKEDEEWIRHWELRNLLQS